MSAITTPDGATSGDGLRPPRPEPGPPRDYRFPHFERRALGNGVGLVIAPVRKLPIVTVMAIVDAGAITDTPGREGVAQLTARLLLEGTDRSDGAELSERFERLGASVESYADWDSTGVGMTVLAEHLEAAVELLGEVLRTPSFPAREVERLKAERLADLLQLRAEPRGLADESFARLLYAESSRYSRPDGGDERSVAAIGREDVQALHRARYVPGATTLIVAGDVTADRVESLAQRVFGDWRGAVPGPITADDSQARDGRALFVVEKSDAPQSELRVGHVGVPRRHPDYFPIVVMNAILGGLFNSRINLNLRERNAYTYGAFSGFEWRRQAGPFVVSTAVQSDVTDAAIREILTEIRRMREEPVAADELSLATSYLDGVFPIRFETTGAIASALAGLVVYELPPDYFDSYRQNIRAVSVDDVQRVARERLGEETMQVVAVGDPSAIRAPLEALGLGPVSVLDPAAQMGG